MKRSALVALAAASPLLLASLLAGAETAFTVLAVGFPVALMALGATRPRVAGTPAGGGGLGPVAAALLALLAVLEAGFVTLLALRGGVAGGVWILGVPLAPWVQLVGIWLLPLLLVPWAYARTFDRHGLTAEDLERVRRARPREGGGS